MQNNQQTLLVNLNIASFSGGPNGNTLLSDSQSNTDRITLHSSRSVKIDFPRSDWIPHSNLFRLMNASSSYRSQTSGGDDDDDDDDNSSITNNRKEIPSPQSWSMYFFFSLSLVLSCCWFFLIISNLSPFGLSFCQSMTQMILSN